jgi:hypothetical protein
MLRVATAILATCIAVSASLRAAEEEDTHTSLAKLPPTEFLLEVRRPLRQNAWGEVIGRIMHSSDQGRTNADIRIRMSFSPEGMHAQLVLNQTNVYAFEQSHAQGDKPKAKIDLPEHETEPGLFSLGVEPEDLTFAFIYWDFVRELPSESFRRRMCRVMDLAAPDGDGFVRVWFHAEHGFPMQAQWYHNDADKPWRTLELKGAKKHDDDLWFVKEMRLEGPGWKTKVRFDHAEINRLGEKGAHENDD